MTNAEMFPFILTIVAIALAPGPAALVILIRAAGRDVRGAAGFSIGYSLGGLSIVTVVCFGLGAFLSAVPEIFDYAKYVMLAYFVWLARGILKSGVSLDEDQTSAGSPMIASIGAGLMTSMISPYNMILFPLMLPGLLDISQIELPEFAIVGTLTFGSFFLGCSIIIIFAAQISRLVRSPSGLRRLNQALAAVLMLAGTWMTFA